MLFIVSPFQPSRGPRKPSGWRLVARETNPVFRALECSVPPPALQGGERRALPRDWQVSGQRVRGRDLRKNLRIAVDPSGHV